MTDEPQESRNPEREQEFAAILATAGGPELVDKLGQLQKQVEFLGQPNGMSRIDNVSLVQVVLVHGIRGSGVAGDPVRPACQWWTTTGQLIAMAETPVSKPGLSPS